MAILLVLMKGISFYNFNFEITWLVLEQFHLRLTRLRITSVFLQVPMTFCHSVILSFCHSIILDTAIIVLSDSSTAQSLEDLLFIAFNFITIQLECALQPQSLPR